MDRPVDHLAEKQRYLIVCEGEKTEPNYFLKFPIQKTSVVDVRGIGANTASLVRKAIELRTQANADDVEYDQVWCVFDRDSFSAKNFNEALDIANKNNIEIAYSNEAFELWYVLHFQYLDTGISRKDYKSLLTKLLGHKYSKKSETIYDELLSRQNTAIKNGKKLYSQYKPKNPEKDKPSTTIFVLVEKLNSLINWGIKVKK
jgi:RloB-like protein